MPLGYAPDRIKSFYAMRMRTMFRSRTCSRLGLILWLVSVMGVGPAEHSHANDFDEAAPAAHEDTHSHNYNGDAIDLDSHATERADAWDADHYHLPSSLDHLHDSWLFLAGTEIPGTVSSALPPHGEMRFPHQNARDRIKKPPRTALRS